MQHKEIRLALLYSAIAIAITWGLWLTSFYLAKQLGIQRIYTGTLFDLPKSYGTPEFLAKLLFTLAVYGPVLSVGIVWLLKADRTKLPISFSVRYPQWWLAVLILPSIFLLSASLLAGPSSWNSISQTSLFSLGSYFLANLLTSGFEEPLWRGKVSRLFSMHHNRWDTAFYSGAIWALWHFPFVVYQTGTTNLLVILPTLLGFTMSIIAANYIYTYLYEKSQNIVLLMVLHAVMNTTNLLLISFSQTAPILSFLPHILFWAIVILIDNFDKEKHGNSKTN